MRNLNEYFRRKVDFPRIRMGKKKEIEIMISEEALLFAKYSKRAIVDIAYRKEGKLVFVELEHKSDWKGNILRASKLCDKLVSVFIREKDVIEAVNFVKQENLLNVEVTDAYYAYTVIP
jgi:hypothetical protein